jgi:hypothetical protein
MDAWEITEMVARGVDFDEAWRRVTGSPRVGVEPFVQAIRWRRFAHGETIKTLSDRSGVNVEVLYSVTRGRQQTITRHNAALLAKALGLDPAEVGL